MSVSKRTASIVILYYNVNKLLINAVVGVASVPFLPDQEGV